MNETGCTRVDGERRRRLRALRLNGLDYVERGPDDSHGRPVVRIYCIGAVHCDLHRSHFAVSGGRRIRGIRVVDVRVHHAQDEDHDGHVDLVLDRVGDFSTYEIRLLEPAHRKFDPFYDRVSFRFHPGCPRGTDCGGGCGDPAHASETGPSLDYRQRDYQGLCGVVLDRLSSLLPDWKETSPADQAIALAEVFAYAGDQISYFQDAVFTEAYLKTARRRVSVRRHALLVGYRMHEGVNARAFVAVETPVDLPPLPASGISFETGLPGSTAPGEVFEPVQAHATDKLNFFRARNELHIHDWGLDEYVLPAGCTRAAFLDPKMELHLKEGDLLLFEERLSPRTGRREDADVRRRHAVRLTRVEQEKELAHDRVLDLDILQVEWGAEDALSCPFAVTVLGPDCKPLKHVSIARANVVLVDHGRSVEDGAWTVPPDRVEAECECRDLRVERSAPGPLFQPRIASGPLVFRESFARDDRHLPSAAASLRQDARRALPVIHLDQSPVHAVSGPATPHRWESRQDLLNSGAHDRHFVVETDDQGRAQLRFGDGELGRRPEAGSRFTPRYRVGGRKAGNVGADTIRRVVIGPSAPALPGTTLVVRNPLPAVGGTEPESMEEAKRLAPLESRLRQEHAVIAADYARLAERDPDVSRAAAVIRWSGASRLALLAVDPLGFAADDDAAWHALRNRLECDIEPFRRMGHELIVVHAKYVPLSVKVSVCVGCEVSMAHVKAQVLAVLGPVLGPGGRLGVFHPDRLTFGHSVTMLEIVSAAMAVPGVRNAEVTCLERSFEGPHAELEAGVLAIGPLEIARVDDDPNMPENGVLEVTVGGGR